MKKLLVIVLLFQFIFPVYAQKEIDHNVNSEVKELSDFHDVIFQIWHTGWPHKDIKFLKSILPAVEKGYEKIKKAELPGILKDKKSKWDDGLKKFGVCVDMYKIACSKKDSISLLNAAEKLHSQFELMVRIIKPVTKEIDSFHQTLYVLYHNYLPADEFEKIKAVASELKTKMEDLNKAPLSQRLKGKEDKFAKVKEELSASVDKLKEVVKAGNNKKDIDKLVNSLHSKYQELEKLFD